MDPARPAEDPPCPWLSSNESDGWQPAPPTVRRRALPTVDSRRLGGRRRRRFAAGAADSSAAAPERHCPLVGGGTRGTAGWLAAAPAALPAVTQLHHTQVGGLEILRVVELGNKRRPGCAGASMARAGLAAGDQLG
jgi:hypothetical protein